MREALRDLSRASVSTSITSPTLRRVRVGVAFLWVVGLLLWTKAFGPPINLLPVFLWLALAMLVASLGNPLGWAKSMLIDWLPLYFLLLAYRVVWGLVYGTGLRPHNQPQLGFDQAIFGAQGATYYLQNWFWHGANDLRPFDWAVWTVHFSHFWVTLAACAVLWMRNREEFLSYRRRVLAVWAVSLCIFAVYPTVPPWMAAVHGRLPPMDSIIGTMWSTVAQMHSGQALGNGDGTFGLYNPVAAVPSLHSAMPLVLMLFFWNRAPRWRPLLVAYPVTMALVLIYAGEHYLFDVFAGWAVVVVVFVAISRWEGRMAMRDSTGHRSGLDEVVPV
jgi:hypothetical protein